MSLLDILPRRLEGTSLESPLEGLHRVYERIDTAQANWMAATPYRCPSGCGFCCEDFEPDILEIEALYLAAWIIRNDVERLEDVELNGHRKGCVLADPSGQYHCAVYGGRPLICRLFAFSGDRDKDGAIRFRPCARMEEHEPRSMNEKELQGRFGVLPPAMGDLASEASCLMPDNSDERMSLRDALPRAAARIRLLTDLAAFSMPQDGSGGGDNDNPDGGTPPMPRAS